MTVPGIISRDEARAADRKRFFTGLPCVHGHTVERLVSCNACVECNAIHNRKPKTRAQVKAYFGNPENKEHIAERNKQYQRDHSDHLKEKHREYMAANREEIQAKRAAARVRDRAKIRAKSQIYRAKNNEKIVAKKAEDYRKNPSLAKQKARAHYWANREQHAEASRNWARRNREHSTAIKRAYVARKISAPGRHTGDDIKAIMRAQKGKCAMCRVSLSRVIKHVDHIIALANGGSNERRNLQVLCQSCNCSKNARDPIEFAQSRGMLI